MTEWLKVAVLKTAIRKYHGFESHYFFMKKLIKKNIRKVLTSFKFYEEALDTGKIISVKDGVARVNGSFKVLLNKIKKVWDLQKFKDLRNTLYFPGREAYPGGVLSIFNFVEVKDIYAFTDIMLGVEGVHLLFEFLAAVIFAFCFWQNNDFGLIVSQAKKLNFLNLCSFILFTFCYAIPNKVYINNKISSWIYGPFVFLVLIVCSSGNIPFCIFAMYHAYCLVFSGAFAYMYDGKTNAFSKMVNKWVFGNNKYLAKLYFRFFWGNMITAFRRRAQALAVTFIGRTVWDKGITSERITIKSEGKELYNDIVPHVQNGTPKQLLDLRLDCDQICYDKYGFLIKIQDTIVSNAGTATGSLVDYASSKVFE